MIVENQKNIKVHLATTEIISQGIAALAAESKYNLGTAFPFVYDMFKTNKCKHHGIINQMASLSKHYILDSGLFTLMFGALKGNKSEAYIQKWAECLMEFVINEKYNGTMVEVDCQKVLGTEKAWEYRQKMAEKLDNRIINVFHIEDGKKGLERLIEYSNYIAISVPELRIIGKKNYLNDIAYFIKNKKPEIDIHLLGCTEKHKLKELNFCTTADSSTWIAGIRFGRIVTRAGEGHITKIKNDILQDNYKKWHEVKQAHFPTLNNPENKHRWAALTFAASEHIKIYENYAGDQN